ncbi:MAG: tRNA pseudouridine(55) synthase TruB [Gemmatimonadetes bacterium]|nr:tRNA pseudouridine(55) synthase TruB [Gemmatimonadota bacterium]MDA1103589.1 tRNA pseudouridine(55) synthase TruB [Gemmatimonadota bacterium]
MTDGAGDFVVPVDKPEGPTSHDVVAMARRGLGTRRIGHTGTLDPFASGLLLLCVGWTTRLAEYLTGLDKTYEAVARLGVTTDTLDRDGVVLSESDAWRQLEESEIMRALSDFAGSIDQVPPQFSAKKLEGEAMHRRARRGEHVELAPVSVTVHDVQVTAVQLPEVRFSMRCSSGTYVRAIARDLGESLGVGAHLTSLRRTSVGSFTVNDAIAVDALKDTEEVARVAVEPAAALAHLPLVEIDGEVARRLLHGQKVRLSNDGSAAPVAVTHEGALFAIGEMRDGVLIPRKVFAS